MTIFLRRCKSVHREFQGEWKQENHEANIKIFEIFSSESSLDEDKTRSFPSLRLNTFKSWFVLPIVDCANRYPSDLDRFILFLPFDFPTIFSFFIFFSWQKVNLARGFGLETKDWIIQRGGGRRWLKGSNEDEQVYLW